MTKSKKMDICIIRNDKMGDMILTLPIIKEIKDNYPNANICVVCSNTNSFLCEEASFVDRYYIFDKKDKLISKIKFLKNFRKNTYDLVFNFSQNIETFFLLLITKSINKSALIYLTRYGNQKFSKIFQRLMIEIFSFDHITIDRNKFYKNKMNFHQAEVMYQLVKKKLNINKSRVFRLIPSKKEPKEIFQERVLIHLSERWIEDKYTEDMFLELLKKLEEKFKKLYITTDQTSYKRFRKIYLMFKKFNDSDLCQISKSNQNIIILDRLNFQNWRNAIINSKLVITYECGCVHVASMSDVPLLVVYDYKNKPYMIHKEYAPLSNKYEKVITSQKFINDKVMLNLKKIMN